MCPSVGWAVDVIRWSQPRTTSDCCNMHTKTGQVVSCQAMKTFVSQQALNLLVTRCGKLSQCRELRMAGKTGARPGSCSCNHLHHCMFVSWVIFDRWLQSMLGQENQFHSIYFSGWCCPVVKNVTDGRTDRIAISISHVSVLTLDKNVLTHKTGGNAWTGTET